MKSVVRTLAVLAICMAVQTASAQRKGAGLSGGAMMENVAKGVEGVKDFVATIEADVNMERVRVPKMSATMYFKQPDKLHFTSSNFAMLPREGLALNPSLLQQRYDAVTRGQDTVEGRMLEKLQLTAKERRTRPAELVLWVDPAHWTIARIQTVPYQGRSLKMDFLYALQAGKYWLPRTLKASFEIISRDTSEANAEQNFDPDMPTPQQQGVRLPTRGGSITVQYFDYKINTGLSDEIFERKEEAPKGK